MQQLIKRVMASRVIRAWNRYAEERGPVLAQGMTLQAFLSLFAALFLAFAIFMAVLGDNTALRDAVIRSISSAVPGLMGKDGAIDVTQLTTSRALDIAGFVAAAAILVTAIAWIGVSREGFRAMFQLDSPERNFVLVKLGDLAVAIGIGLLVLTSAAILVVTNAFVGSLGLGWTTELLGIVSQIVLDTAIVLLLFRFGGQLQLRARQIVPAALACALGFQGLKLVASQLLGGVDNNPLLAGIAAPVIILIWLGFIMQVLLLVLAFVAVGPHGVAYTRLVKTGGIDRTLSREEAQRLLDELRKNRTKSYNSVKTYKRLSERRG